mmetsp:Transcript_2903/g.7612  ORF Transcript_2903/g.7612 Transcript_2903/m.7612 type:complete len:316 (+) Transcript_2903:891-1838(+)
MCAGRAALDRASAASPSPTRSTWETFQRKQSAPWPCRQSVVHKWFILSKFVFDLFRNRSFGNEEWSSKNPRLFRPSLVELVVSAHALERAHDPVLDVEAGVLLHRLELRLKSELPEPVDPALHQRPRPVLVVRRLLLPRQVDDHPDGRHAKLAALPLPEALQDGVEHGTFHDALLVLLRPSGDVGDCVNGVLLHLGRGAAGGAQDAFQGGQHRPVLVLDDRLDVGLLPKDQIPHNRHRLDLNPGLRVVQKGKEVRPSQLLHHPFPQVPVRLVQHVLDRPGAVEPEHVVVALGQQSEFPDPPGGENALLHWAKVKH